MPRYRVMDGFRINATLGDVYPGDEVEVGEREASMFASRLARLPDPEPETAEVADAVEPEHADPEPETRDPKATRRR